MSSSCLVVVVFSIVVCVVGGSSLLRSLLFRNGERIDRLQVVIFSIVVCVVGGSSLLRLLLFQNRERINRLQHRRLCRRRVVGGWFSGIGCVIVSKRCERVRHHSVCLNRIGETVFKSGVVCHVDCALMSTSWSFTQGPRP